MRITVTLISIAFFLSACNDPPPNSVQEIVQIQSGEEIFALYCAQCHGFEGDGKGLIELDRPARSFVDGGFSFGNTVEAIVKTTRSGIPGTPMPPFADILSQEEIAKVATHVRQFSPTMKDATPEETEIIVTTRPSVVRGMIPPIKEGLKLHPRGLLVGNPDGFSYEYRVDDVRLLAIRQGRFVERTDWTGRGGSPLKPIGKVVVLVDEGNPNAMFVNADGALLRAKLKSTVVSGPVGVIRYDLVDNHGKIYATISETCRPTTGARALIEQLLTIESFESIQITLPTTATTDDQTTISPGNHTRTIIHAARGNE